MDRFISGYYYWKTLHPAPAFRAANELSIYDFARSSDPAVVELIDNAQTWQLYWHFDATARLRFADRPQREILEGAKRNIASLDFVGLQEDVAGTLAKMKERFAWRWTDEPTAIVNPTARYDPALVDRNRLREALGSRIALDEELYEFARELFEKG
jgi:hypothetical protein